MHFVDLAPLVVEVEKGKPWCPSGRYVSAVNICPAKKSGLFVTKCLCVHSPLTGVFGVMYYLPWWAKLTSPTKCIKDLQIPVSSKKLWYSLNASVPLGIFPRFLLQMAANLLRHEMFAFASRSMVHVCVTKFFFQISRSFIFCL